MENYLNELTGSQWLYWTNTIYETNFPPDQTHGIRKKHGAMKPPELMAEIIKFFSKSGELIIDPFAGVGSTLLGAELAGREALGIEINPHWISVYEELRYTFRQDNGILVKSTAKRGTEKNIVSKMLFGDCLKTLHYFPEESVAAIITDPPYGCQNSRIVFKNETNFNMKSYEKDDFGNCLNYQDFFNKIKLFGIETYRILKPGRYLVLLIGDRYVEGEYYPLGVFIAQILQKVGFKWKGIRIWWNKATQRPLKPYAVKSCFVPNITHQNILILRKEINEK